MSKLSEDLLKKDRSASMVGRLEKHSALVHAGGSSANNLASGNGNG